MTGIYFDNAATTPPLAEVLERYAAVAGETFGNPSSLHYRGIEAELVIKKAADELASLMDIKPSELIFTSGGTESNSLAILGAAKAYAGNGRHLITTAVEHPSVRECFKALEAQGFQVTYLNTNGKGYIDLEALNNAITEKTILVSVIHINNEFGTILPVEKIGSVIKARNRSTLFHVDGVQSFGKYKTPLGGRNIDLFSFSAHKIHGLKGVGGLYKKKAVRLAPIFFGGGQQDNIRPGTENPAGIAALAEAARIAHERMDINLNTVRAIRERLLKIAEYADITVNGDCENGSPYILNLSFGGKKAEVVLNALSEAGICVSTGSACGERRRKAEGNVLRHLGLSPARMEAAVRFSFSGLNTVDEAGACVEVLKGILPYLVGR